jgi:predicted ATPase
LESKNHILLAHEPAWQQFLNEVHQFLGVESGEQSGPPASPKRQTVSAPTPPPTSPPVSLFVACQRELAQLQAHLDQVLTGHSRVVFITGEAGRGKTSLLAEFARQAQRSRSDLIVAAGACSAPGGLGDPYLPFRDVLALLTGDLESRLATGAVEPEQARRLWAFLPQTVKAIVEHGPTLLNTLVSGPALLKRVTPYAEGQPDWLGQLQGVLEPQPARSGHLEQGQLFEQVRQVLQTLAGQQPLLLLFDDLQWLYRFA